MPCDVFWCISVDFDVFRCISVFTLTVMNTNFEVGFSVMNLRKLFSLLCRGSEFSSSSSIVKNVGARTLKRVKKKRASLFSIRPNPDNYNHN